MTADELLDAFAHPCFMSLEQRRKDWIVTYRADIGIATIANGTLTTLLEQFLNVVAEMEIRAGL